MTPGHAGVVVNPAKVDVAALRRAVRAQEQVNGWAATRWYETQREDAGRGAAEQALADGAAVVIVAGGDGTVRAVAEVLRGTEVPLAIVPSGTGNLLARELGTPLNDVEGAVAAAFEGDIRAIDVGLAEFTDEAGDRHHHVFVVMAGIGLDAEMAEHTSALAKTHLGWLAYVAPIAKSIVRNRLFRIDFRVDGGRTRSTHAHTVIVGNCGTLTGNLLLIPAAIVDDGLLDVVMMRPTGRFGWARIGTRLTLQGSARRSKLLRRVLRRVPELRALAYAQGRRFEARFSAPRLMQLDGDSFGGVERVRIRVQPRALRVSVPRPRDQGVGPASAGPSDPAE